MDTYTSNTREWLDERFRQANADGVYRAHQPIYGFRVQPCDGEYCERYSLTYQIMKALSYLRFNSLLDVGGAEGYKAALVREMFAAGVRSCDLSGEACARARELYGIEADAVDNHELPYGDASFDVVLSSETLEHVTDLAGAARELSRIASKAVVITVPHEPHEAIEENIRQRIPHAHIHSLTTNSFDFLYAHGVHEIITHRCLSRFTRRLFIAFDASPRKYKRERKGAPDSVRWAYNKTLPIARLLLGQCLARAAIHSDHALAKIDPHSKGMVLVCLKDPQSKLPEPSRHISLRHIMAFRVAPLMITTQQGTAGRALEP